MSRKLYDSISKLNTEQQNPASETLDTMSTSEILELINREDSTVAAAVAKCIPEIGLLVGKVVTAFKSGHRLIYIGAGTSGRLGVVDAAECPPTFGTDPEQVQAFIAGGKEAMFVAQEGAEDSLTLSTDDLKAIKLEAGDVLVGLAASGRTPYVVTGIEYARSIGCHTALICTVPEQQARDNGANPEIFIACPVGPEVVTGSTRMKSGTAQKLILNMLTTASMVKMGKTLGNVMVDLKPTNAKLVERSKKTISQLTGLSYEESAQLLENANRHVKTALVMHFTDCERDMAMDAIKKTDGHTKMAIRYILDNK